jgi:hypothetical protein
MRLSRLAFAALLCGLAASCSSSKETQSGIDASVVDGSLDQSAAGNGIADVNPGAGQDSSGQVEPDVGVAGGKDVALGGSGGSDGGGGSGGSASPGSGGGGGTAQGTGGAPAPLYALIIDAPKNNDTVSGVVQIRGWARGFVNVETWDATHSDPPLAQAVPSTDGAFAMQLSTAGLATGATTWTVWAWDAAPGKATDTTKSASVSLSLTIGAGTAGGAGGAGTAAAGGAGGSAGSTGAGGTAGAVAGGRNYLMGFYTNGKLDGPYHTWLGYYPEVDYGSSYQEHSPGGSFYPPSLKYPEVFDVDIHNAKLDYADVASGKADKDLIATRDSLPSDWYPYIYAIRIDSEFNLACDADPAICNGDPATCRSAAEHVIDLYKAKLPARVKYIWNPNIYHGSNLDQLVPTNCDVIGVDAYAQPQWNASSQYLFGNKANPESGSLWWWTQVAQKKGKAIALPEWGDDYGDGAFVRDVAAWAGDPANNVVYLGYWDSADSEDAHLRGASLTAFTSVFANLPYTGTLFAPLISTAAYPSDF